MNPFPDYFSRFKFNKAHIEHLFVMCYNIHVAPVFITGTAGMGKNELAKTYAKKNEKKYTNIIHLFCRGGLKKYIAHMEFSDNTADMSEEMLFDKHMRILKKLHPDSLIIIDNFNVLHGICTLWTNRIL